MNLLAVIVPGMFVVLVILFVIWNKFLKNRFSIEDWVFRCGLLWIIGTVLVMLFMWSGNVPRTATFLYVFYASFGLGALACIVGLVGLIWNHKLNKYHGAENWRRGVNGA